MAVDAEGGKATGAAGISGLSFHEVEQLLGTLKKMLGNESKSNNGSRESNHPTVPETLAIETQLPGEFLYSVCHTTFTLSNDCRVPGNN